MNLSGSLFLGWRYLLRHPRIALLLTAAISLSLFLPLGIYRVVQTAQDYMRARAVTTPLLLGAPGSPLELVFNGIYFTEPGVATLPLSETKRPRADGLAATIPVYARHRSGDFRIVGTTLDYFTFRGLELQSGRLFGRIGDCVIGAQVAARLGLGSGDTLVSTPEQMFDLAGVYPLKMRITGVLASTGGPDDRAIFADVKTTWIIDGLAHGHQDATKAGAATVLEREGDNVVMNAAVVEYNEVTDENLRSFHFHGDQNAFPVTAAIVIPRDTKAATILLGRYVEGSNAAQLVRPDEVMGNLFATVFQVRNFIIVSLIAVGIMSLMIAGLVFLLSNRLRSAEFESLFKIGADASGIAVLISFEAFFVFAASLTVAFLLLLLLQFALPSLLPLLAMAG